MIWILNSVIMICWTALAAMFNKWWIALFAILFLFSAKTTNKAYRVCDMCGKHSPYAKDHNAALEKAKKAGWISKRIGDKIEDYCPECQIKLALLTDMIHEEKQNNSSK